MKIKITIILLLSVITTAHAQQKVQTVSTIDVAQLSKQGAIKGKDLVIADAALDKYMGTWVWTGGANTLKIKFVKQVHHYGSQDKVLDMETITGSYEFSEAGKLKVAASGDDFVGSSGGKRDSLNVFMSIKPRKTQVALLITYINQNSIKLEVDWNRFEFKNDKDFELPKPVTLTKQ